MAELRNIATRANGDTQTWSVDELRNQIAHPSHIEPAESHLLAFVGDQLVATSEIEWADTTQGQRHYRSLGWVLPEWRRRGIGEAMLSRNEARIAEIAATHKLGKPATMVSWLADLDAGGLALFRSRGYQRARVYHHMTRPDLDDVDIAPLPPGLVVRSVRPDETRRLFDALIEAFRDHFGGHDGSTEAFLRWSGDPGFDLDLAIVAFDRHEVAGGVIGYIDADENRVHRYKRGWADPVFTRRQWRQRGLASALLGRNLVRLREHGMTSAQLDVDSENPNAAIGLYMRHRFVVDHSGSEWHRFLEV